MPQERLSARPYFFVHIMKTSGGSFKNMLRRVFARENCFPQPVDGDQDELNLQPNSLVLLSVERRAQVRLYSGHYPLVAKDLIRPEPYVLALFRHPVERNISHLKHRRRNMRPQATLKELYGDPLLRDSLLSNFQTKLFGAKSLDELPDTLRPLAVGNEHLERAMRNVDRCDFIGLRERFADSVHACEAMFGWDMGPIVFRNVGGEPTVDAELRAQIEADCQYDFALYEHVRRRFEEQLDRVGVPACG